MSEYCSERELGNQSFVYSIFLSYPHDRTLLDQLYSNGGITLWTVDGRCGSDRSTDRLVDGRCVSLLTTTIVGCVCMDAADLWMGQNRGGKYVAET